jgi:hypothetical protein
MARESKARKAAQWLRNNPHRSVNEATHKFGIQASAIYAAKKQLSSEPDQLMNTPMVLPIAPNNESFVIIVKTSDPAHLLRSLFQ